MIAEGKQAKEIAGVLGISSRTVEFHKYRIMETLGLRTITELRLLCGQAGHGRIGAPSVCPPAAWRRCGPVFSLHVVGITRECSAVMRRDKGHGGRQVGVKDRDCTRYARLESLSKPPSGR
jgi:Bacterial regulatory proteins, luxR family